eukprot:22618_1
MAHTILQASVFIISLSSNIYLSTSQNCYAQYDCYTGYMDKTEGTGFDGWECGYECPGRVYYTDIGCSCACIPESTCQPTASPIIPHQSVSPTRVTPSPTTAIPSQFPSEFPSKSPTDFDFSSITYSKYLWLDQKTYWERAQFLCEYTFGSNLATVITNDDWKEAKAVMYNLGLFNDSFWTGLNDNERDWSVLFPNNKVGAKYHWADSTSCNYTSTGLCNDDIHFDSGNYHCTFDNAYWDGTTHWDGFEHDICFCAYFHCCAKMNIDGDLIHNACYPDMEYAYSQSIQIPPERNKHPDPRFNGSRVATNVWVEPPQDMIEPQYIMCSGNNKYIIITTKSYTWLQAQEYCQLHYSELGLAIINTENDSRELTSLRLGSGIFHHLLWFGGSHSHNSGCKVLFENELPFDHDCNEKLPFVCHLNSSLKLSLNSDNIINDISNYWIRMEQIQYAKEFNYIPAATFENNRAQISLPTAYWNDVLYFVARDYKLWKAEIQFPNVNYDLQSDIINNPKLELDWEYTQDIADFFNFEWAKTSSVGGYGQTWTQFGNVLYFMIVTNRNRTLGNSHTGEIYTDYDWGNYIYQVVLDTVDSFDTYYYELQGTNLTDNINDICITTGGTDLFLIADKIYFFSPNVDDHDSQKGTNIWPEQSNDSLFDDLKSVGCSTNLDNTFLYIFGGYRHSLKIFNDVIFKYDILNDKLYEINIPLPKSYMFTKTILAPNGNIYFYGNTTQQRNDQYLIFNSKIEQFDSRKHTKDLYYKPRVISSAAISKSNMLIRLDYKKKFFFPKRVQNIDISYLITNRVSIDLRPLSQQIIDPTYNGRWPILRDHYKMIEYTNKPNNYSFIFSINIFNTVIQKIVNISYETCIFCDYENSNDNEYSNNCFDCAIGINLITDTSLITAGDHQSMVHIKLNDNSGIDDLLLFTNHGSANQNSANEGAFSFLIHTPCIIYFDSLNNLLVNTGDNIEIIGNYKFDNYCVDIENDTVSKLTFISEELSINKQVTFIGYNCTSIVDIQFPEDSSPCDYGLRPILTNITRQIYNIEIKSSNTNNMMTAIPSLIQIKINECALGEGLIPSSSVIECQKCEINQFKVIEGFLPCYNCEHEIEGVSCLGSDQILIDYNYWSSGYNMQKNIFPIDIELVTNVNNDKMYSHMCPPMYCCNKKNGCLYINDSTGTRDSESLCANGRFATSILCSKCVADKYELFGSTTCGACSEYNWLLLGIIFVLALSFVIFIFIDSSKINLNPYKQNEINWKYLFIKDEQMFLKIMIFKVMTYYFQSLSQILSNKGINHVFIPILGLFNFSIDEMYNNKNGICVIPYLDALNEIIFSLIFIMFIIFHFIWLSIGLFGYRSYNSTDSEKN